MPLADLKLLLENELTANPLLEEVRAGRPAGFDDVDGSGEWLRDVLTQKPVSLGEHLLRQLGLLSISRRQLAIGREIIGNLNEDGYLCRTIAEIAEDCGVKLSEAESVLSLVQAFDPSGVACRDLRECLLIQLKSKNFHLAEHLLKEYLHELETKKFKVISVRLKVSEQDVHRAVEEIRRLDPKPGRQFSQTRSVTIVPEVEIYRRKRKYEVRLNHDEFPELKINAHYRELLAAADTQEETKRYLKEKMRAALDLMRALQERRKTVKRLARLVADAQEEFFEQGPSCLKALTFQKVAEALEVHKSTVWRAAAGKFVATPQGTYELKFFFSPSLPHGGGGYSVRSVQARLQEIVRHEDRSKPLSDQKIVTLLGTQGFPVSRRTVTKYRKKLRLQSSYLRKA